MMKISTLHFTIDLGISSNCREGLEIVEEPMLERFEHGNILTYLLTLWHNSP